MFLKNILCISLLFLLSINSFSKDVPSLSSPVMDEVGLLSNSTKLKLKQYLKKLYKNHSTQVQVYIIDSLEGESIEDYSIKVVEKWQLGKNSTDMGVLFLMAMKDRKLRIEVGDGLEGVLTDSTSGRIIDSIVPYFKASQFDEGILFGVNAIVSTIVPEAQLNRVKTKKTKAKSKNISIYFIIIWFLIILFGRGRRFSRGGYYYSGRSGGFSSGGGSWSGGGGSFSGGGSSGSW